DRDEAQLAGVAQMHHSPGDTDHVLGLSAGFELIGVVLAHLGDRVRDRHTYRVRITAGVENPLALVPAHTYLFGGVGRCGFVHGGVRRCGLGCLGHSPIVRSVHRPRLTAAVIPPTTPACA